MSPKPGLSDVAVISAKRQESSRLRRNLRIFEMSMALLEANDNHVPGNMLTTMLAFAYQPALTAVAWLNQSSKNLRTLSHVQRSDGMHDKQKDAHA